MTNNGNSEQSPSRRPFTYKTENNKTEELLKSYKKVDAVLFGDKIIKKRKRYIK